MSDQSMIDDIIANNPEMLESFVNESKDCLIVAETDLKYLLDHPDDPERIERAFRSVHSLKSAAGFLGLNNVAVLALRMEKRLESIRAGATASDAENIDFLLKGLVVLNTMLQDITPAAEMNTRR